MSFFNHSEKKLLWIPLFTPKRDLITAKQALALHVSSALWSLHMMMPPLDSRQPVVPSPAALAPVPAPVDPTFAVGTFTALAVAVLCHRGNRRPIASISHPVPRIRSAAAARTATAGPRKWCFLRGGPNPRRVWRRSAVRLCACKEKSLCGLPRAGSEEDQVSLRLSFHD
jgi:hypothetical protein